MPASTPYEIKTSDGLTLRGIVAGPAQGRQVVLLHGGGQTRHSWAKTVKVLVDNGYRVLAYDARGHGDSDWSPTGDYSIPTLSNDLLTILAALDQPAALIGASMGGLTAFHTVGTESGPVAQALIMVDITLQPAAEGVEKINRFMTAHLDGFASLEEAAEAVAVFKPNPARRANPAGLARNLRKRDDGRFYWHWDPRVLEATGEGWLEELPLLSHRVSLPLMLLRGGQSDIVDDSSVDMMIEALPQLEIMDVAGVGHMVVGDSNDAFNDGCLDFLRRCF
ncbi:alpha/beta hydrolase [Sphingobium sp. AN558]|uniref:alpha/beta fold hydrolase n=1 Tax=Sphingobium sp. AN558 TaxID=3133442 RepID=UPI0030BCF240